MEICRDSCRTTARLLRRSLLSTVMAASLAWAQGVTGVISGTVTDGTKAPVAGAVVTITNADRGVVAWSGATNESGVYRAPDLPVGQYGIAVSAQGFKGQRVSDIQLTIDQHADIGIQLEVGAVSETVTVEGATGGS